MSGQPTVLVIAGTDSSGGAGLVRDLRMLADCGAHAVVAVTAVTAQSDARVWSIHPVPAQIVRDQILAAFEAHAIGAVKIGMLGTREIVEAIADSLPRSEAVPVVLDPILAASSGGSLLDAGGRAALRERLLPRATLITPNIPEAAVLLGEAPARDKIEMIEQARRLQHLGARAVLLKAGHATGMESTDVFVSAAGEVERMACARLPVSRRGTGCALASAIAAGLAGGLSLAESCRLAKRRLTADLKKSEQAGY